MVVEVDLAHASAKLYLLLADMMVCHHGYPQDVSIVEPNAFEAL